MPDEDKSVDKSLPAPPSEPDISLSGFHEFRADVFFTNMSHSFLLQQAFADEFQGVGRVELVDVEVTYIHTQANQRVAAGFANAQANYTVDQIAMSGGFMAQSNSLTIGVMHKHTLIIPGYVSRQIQPISSLLPGVKFHIAVSAGVGCSVCFKFHIFGPRVVKYLAKDLKGMDSAKEGSDSIFSTVEGFTSGGKLSNK